MTRRYYETAEDAWRAFGLERWRWPEVRRILAEHEPVARWYVQGSGTRVCAEGAGGHLVAHLTGRRLVLYAQGEPRRVLAPWGDSLTQERGAARRANSPEPTGCPHGTCQYAHPAHLACGDA
jgi:hypothetical protein